MMTATDKENKSIKYKIDSHKYLLNIQYIP